MSSVQMIIEDLSEHPKCAHGPTLLFKRNVNGEMKTFYACSACRDRKDCSFFLWQHERKTINDVKNPVLIDHESLQDKFNEIMKLPEDERSYCHKCSVLFWKSETRNHCNHDVTATITNTVLQHPSELIKPLENPKKEAQYLFANNSVNVIIDILQSNNLKNILCIGAPRIHEYVKANCKDMNSLLMDMDHRYHSFYTNTEYSWYNMFNHHFFSKSGKYAYENFMKKYSKQNIAIVTDPPFGGRVEPIAYTIEQIDKQYKLIASTSKDLPVLWIFPYFMEPQIQNSLPNYTMLDYKVDYDNHPLFQDGPKSRKLGSPVRIFTNIPQSHITLPPTEGYKYCSKCMRWIYAENKHCYKCNACTSKDGRTYVHCDICKRCVKPSWTHCNKCQRCTLEDHKCGEIKFNQECFHCKEKGHKKRDCLKAKNDPKRKAEEKKIKNRKKMKML